MCDVTRPRESPRAIARTQGAGSFRSTPVEDDGTGSSAVFIRISCTVQNSQMPASSSRSVRIGATYRLPAINTVNDIPMRHFWLRVSPALLRNA